MPSQTTAGTENIYFPDSCKLEIKASGDGDFTDLGIIEGDVTASYEWEAKETQFANKTTILKKITKMSMKSSFTLNSLNPVGIEKLGAGVFTKTATAGAEISTIPDQIIAAGWADHVQYDLVLYTSSAVLVKNRVVLQPVLTSVEIATDTTPETLVEDNDYIVTANPDSVSGWSIQFIEAGMSVGTPTTREITIGYSANTVVASTTLTAGTSSKVLSAFEIKYTHTDSAGLKRYLYMPSCTPDSGGFQFSFMSALADGVEKMPIAITANLDPTQADGAQLFTWVIETGAA